MSDREFVEWGSTADPRRAVWAAEQRNNEFRPAARSLEAFFAEGMPDEVRRRVLVDRRIKQVHEQFAAVVDAFILEHVNSVYLMRSKIVEGAYDLVVYLDNSTCAAELNARRELIRLKYQERFSIVVDVFEIRISRGHYKDQHPFAAPVGTDDGVPAPERALTPEEVEEIDATVAPLPPGRMRDSFVNAMTAQKKHSKKEK